GATVEWTLLTGVETYQIEIYDTDWEPAVSVSASAPPVEILGLTPGKSYYAVVAPVCVNGTGGGPFASFVTLCPVPTGLSVEPGTTNALLTWNDYGADYEIELFDGTETTHFIADGSPFILTGLTPQTTYSVRIRALCAETESDYGETVVFSTFVCPVAENVVVESVGATQAQIRWAASDLADEGYAIVVSNPTLGTLEFVAFASPFTIEGLAPGANYDATITALCGLATSEPTAFSFSTLCPAVENFDVSQITENSALLTWNDGPNYDGYFVYYHPQSDPSDPVSAYVYVNEYPIEGLTPGTNYTAVIRTVCVDFDSEVRTITFATVCPEPTVAASGAEDRIVLEVSGVYGDAFGVKIERGSQTILEQTVNVVPEGEYEFAGLDGGTTYIVTVTSFCPDVASSVVYEVTTVCPPPNGGEIVEVGPTSVVVSWDVVNGVTLYEMNLYSLVQSIGRDDLTAEDAPFTFTGLIPGTTYEAELGTRCAESFGDYQILGTFVTPCPPPSDLTLVQSTATTAQFSWTAVEGVSEYLLTLQPGDLQFSLFESPATISDLVPGTVYTAFLVSVCTEFNSEASNVVEFSTPCPDVLSVEASDITATSATLTWTAVPGAASYTVELNNLGAGTSEFFAEIAGTSLDLTDLIPNTGYSANVYANCLGGESSVNPATTTFQTLCATLNLIAVASDPTPCALQTVELSVEQSLSEAGYDPSEFLVTWQPGGFTGVEIAVQPETTTEYSVVAVRDGCEYAATTTLSLAPTAYLSDDRVCIVVGGTGAVEVFDAPVFRVEPEDDASIVGNSIVFSTGISGAYTVVVTDVNECEQYLVVNVWVNDPANFNLSDGQQFFSCSNPVELEGTPAGGEFTADPPGLLFGTTLAPATAEPGEYTITYTYVGVGGCETSRSVTVMVGGTPTATIEAVDGDNVLCSYQAGPFALSAMPAGGTFVGDGVAGGLFTPSGPGEYAIHYEVEEDGCTFTSSFSFTVLNALVASVETTISTGVADVTLT
ncbi:MAG: fibronectin type III domain-containing protein, partial [Bacteroidia bacterium]|nr:fibronectin type III domain-containing protein [Bacteroidia bacterium]